MDRRLKFVTVVSVILVAAVVGVIAYNAGVTHGLAISAAQSGAPAGPQAPYGWYRPWGFGFSPFLVLVLMFFVFRFVFWGFWGGFYRHGWRYARPYDGPSRFDEWHRRSHERMNEPPAAGRNTV